MCLIRLSHILQLGLVRINSHACTACMNILLALCLTLMISRALGSIPAACSPSLSALKQVIPPSFLLCVSMSVHLHAYFKLVATLVSNLCRQKAHTLTQAVNNPRQVCTPPQASRQRVLSMSTAAQVQPLHRATQIACLCTSPYT